MKCSSLGFQFQTDKLTRAALISKRRATQVTVSAIGHTNADADAGQGSTAKIIGSFAVGECDDFVLNVILHGGVRQTQKWA